MPDTYEEGNYDQALYDGVDFAGFANSKWKVQDMVSYYGGTKGLAQKLVENGYYGDRQIKNPVASLQRNIQRWEKFESTGIKNKNSNEITDKASNIIQDLIHEDQMKENEELGVEMNGPIKVNKYKRKRLISFTISAEDAKELLGMLARGNADGAWDLLANAYGVTSLGVAEGAKISFVRT